MIADSCVERWPPGRLQAAVAERTRQTPEQVAFWRYAHGDDRRQVVDADSDLLLLAQRSGDWFNGRLRESRCPVLFTASLRDEALLEVERQVCTMTKQVPGSRVFFANAGGHPLMWSRPEDFRCAADCFLVIAQPAINGTRIASIKLSTGNTDHTDVQELRLEP